MAEHQGHCLCGAVTVNATNLARTISACHCEMCRRWSGSIQMGIEAKEGEATVSGPVKVYRSSDFAERAWCDKCGSAVWFRNFAGKDVGYYEFVPGLFENAADAKLVRVVYADCCPDGYALAGDYERVSKADYEAEFDFVPEESA
ncbi:MAG: GFA family protein [Silicimonas sp.]|nr:GFA family protein [Silicimonas sp.]